MAQPRKADVVAALLDLHGRTYGEEIGFDVSRNTPSALFRLLCASLLFSARISAGIAVEAARALARQRWTTARRLGDSAWAERAKVLNEAGYARYDERTAAMLGDTAELALDRYDGDLRNLRDAADGKPAKERALLKQFKGIGDVGADIFFREVQGAWEELYPFADKRALAGAHALGLGDDAQSLRRRVDRADFPRFVAACVRVAQAGEAERVRRRALGEPEDTSESAGDEREGTKAELYERARQLGIPGRSRMTKHELAGAVADAR